MVSCREHAFNSDNLLGSYNQFFQPFLCDVYLCILISQEQIKSSVFLLSNYYRRVVFLSCICSFLHGLFTITSTYLYNSLHH
ncbi:hypothetical protein VIGAN_02069700 [Vigna angularis var. angularis]|uniref:Uncharacterized protein n=1 Tax=Vigna angularis var. angularis TaxID=157739 RepID=A0A0S3RC43_PHAAN|nr:hypothetical protein VIGAN_02069700 [Vigna angularis var. angularis]